MIRIIRIDDGYIGGNVCINCSLEAVMALTYGPVGASQHVSLCEECAQEVSEEIQTFNDLLEDEEDARRWQEELEDAANEEAENSDPYRGPRDYCEPSGQDSNSMVFVDEDETFEENFEEDILRPLVISKDNEEIADCADENEYEAEPEKTIFDCT